MLVRCPECGIELTEEMWEANMCWECGKILDESLLDKECLNEMIKQAEEVNPYNNPKIREHKVTTGYDFQGYRIEKYVGLVSGEIVCGTGMLKDFKASVSDLFGAESKAYAGTIKAAKKSVLVDMIKESISFGGNAIIGIDYDIITLGGNMIGVSVNGTSVIIGKQ